MVHMTVLIKRKDGMTKEQFDEYWANTHATVFLNNPVIRDNLVKYSQQHINSGHVGRLATMDVKQPDADGVVHFWARNIDDLLAVFDSEYYKNVVVPDEHKFLKREDTVMTIGEDDDKWANGQAGKGVDTSKWS